MGQGLCCFILREFRELLYDRFLKSILAVEQE